MDEIYRNIVNYSFINSDKRIVNLHNWAIPMDDTDVNSIHPCKYVI